jgi:uncharacterized protein
MKLDIDRQPLGQTWLTVAYHVDLGTNQGSEAVVQVRGDLQIDNLESRILVRGELVGVRQVPCDRCLESFTLDFDVPLEIIVLRDSAGEDEADTWVIHQKTGEVDLANPLREAVLLALPQKQVCAITCAGICAQCGANLNLAPCSCRQEAVDPRWEGLPDD